MKKSIIKYSFVACLMFCAAVFASAQDVSISAEKKALIGEMIAVTKADKGVEDVMRAMLKQLDDGYPQMVDEMVNKRTDLSPAQKKQIVAQMNSSNAGRSKFQDRFLAQLDFHEFVELTFYPLYDKFFTESELRDLVAFYKTPTGLKMIGVMPELTTEAVRLAQTVLVPKLAEISNKIISEDIATVQAPASKSPRPKN